MRRILVILSLLLCLPASAQYQSWAISWLQCASSAQMGRNCMGITNFFPGVGITFTKTGPLSYVISNTGTNIAAATNAIYAQYATNWLGSTNFYNSLPLTNYIPGLNVNFNFIPPSTYEISSPAPAPPPATELEGDVLAGPGYGLLTATVTNISPLGAAGQVLTATGTGVAWSNVVCTTVGISITQSVTDLIIGAITNVFSNGLLVATGPYVAPGSYLIQPAGLGYLLLTDGGKILLP